MEDAIIPVAIIALLFVAFPAVILHYVTQWKKTRGLSNQDEQMLQQLFVSAQKLEERISNLERVLDTDRSPTP
jgi:phage shock protein B